LDHHNLPHRNSFFSFTLKKEGVWVEGRSHPIGKRLRLLRATARSNRFPLPEYFLAKLEIELLVDDPHGSILQARTTRSGAWLVTL